MLIRYAIAIQSFPEAKVSQPNFSVQSGSPSIPITSATQKIKNWEENGKEKKGKRSPFEKSPTFGMNFSTFEMLEVGSWKWMQESIGRILQYTYPYLAIPSYGTLPIVPQVGCGHQDISTVDD